MLKKRREKGNKVYKNGFYNTKTMTNELLYIIINKKVDDIKDY